MNRAPRPSDDGAGLRDAFAALGARPVVDVVLESADVAAAHRIARVLVETIDREAANRATITLALALKIAGQIESAEKRQMTAELINALVARLATMGRLAS